jgi:hypothetical protein
MRSCMTTSCPQTFAAIESAWLVRLGCRYLFVALVDNELAVWAFP